MSFILNCYFLSVTALEGDAIVNGMACKLGRDF